MKRKKSLFIFFISLIIISQNTFSQKEERIFCEQIKTLNATLKLNHFSPKRINDNFSKAIFDLFINSLDSKKNIFTKNDFVTLNKEKDTFDNFINANDCAFIDSYISLLKGKTEGRIQFLSALKEEKLNYQSSDSIFYISEKEYSYSKNQKTLNAYWNKKIRLNILHKIYEKDSTLSYLKKNFVAFEKSIKQEVIAKEICLLEEALHQDMDILVKERFLNAIAQYQDSNSSFFNYSEKEAFENSLSNNSLSFGIITDKNDKGDIIINYIRPGSTAFLSQKFEEKDVLLNLTSNKASLNTNCVSIDNVVKFLNKHETILFKIKKKSGKILEVALKKSVSRIEENSVRGYIVNNNFGYIKIGSFYTSLDSSNKLGLANDVAKEVYRLKKENITGLILDLRFNGGGSMREASDLVGMFIDRGPITILREKTAKPITIKDHNRGSIFTKPLVIIVNSFSASASELFAGAMQDYNRAIIVGSKTYGKATSQVILPINEDITLGFAKITVEKFYRISGKSHQAIGIVPDIQFPSFYDNFKTGEQYNKFTLKADTILVSLKHNPLAFPYKEDIIKKSKVRNLSNKGFNSLKKMNAYYLKNYINKKSSYGLNLESVYNHQNKISKGWSALENSFKAIEKTGKIEVKNSKSTLQIIQFNEEDTKNNTLILDDISTDFYINEASNILTDYLHLNKK